MTLRIYKTLNIGIIYIIIFVALSATQAEATYKTDQGSSNSDNILCAAWKRNADGSWTQTEAIETEGAIMIGNTIIGGEMATLLERNCNFK